MEQNMMHELSFLGIYISPLVPILVCAVIGAVFSMVLLNKTGLSRYFANPPWVFAALCIIYTCLLFRT